MKRTDVLLAMGSPALLKSMEEALLREGLTVRTIGNGIDAVLETMSLRPRCLVCGQVLAGMDGLKVCRLISSLYSRQEVPVIVSVPDSRPEMKQRALSAGAVAVVDYSTSMDDLFGLVRLHLSETRVGSSVSGGSALSRERILTMSADLLESSLEAAETVVHFAGGLRGVATISEACRKLSAAVLRGLGFQRVWVGLVNGSRTAVEAVSYKGRGLTGESIPIGNTPRRLPVDLAISSGSQTSSWEGDFTDSSFEWAGSRYYVDTPISIGKTVFGLIRCDNGLSRKKPAPGDLRSLRMLADSLSNFIRYLDARNRLEERTASIDWILSELGSVALFLDPSGKVAEFSGDFTRIPGVQSPARGDKLESVLSGFPPETRKRVCESVTTGKIPDTGPVRTDPPAGWTGLSIRVSPASEAILTLTDMTASEEMRERIGKLEFETDAIASLAADLTAENDAREICRTMLRTLETFYPDESIAVMAASSSSASLIPDSLEVHALSGSGYRSGALIPGASLQIDPSGSGDGVVAEAVRSSGIINVPDVMHCSFYIDGLAETRSELAVPMLSRGRIVGLIDIQSRVQGRFRSDDVRRINNIVGFSAGVLDAALQKTELINMARRDRLTGLHNMTFFEERYPEEFDRAQRYSYPFSLIMMDIDDFKNYNDSYGHPMGNVLLQKVTTAMTAALRDVDILIRYGGEEFLCILPLTEKHVAEEIAERIRNRVLEANSEIPHAGQQPRGCVSLSLGVATFPEDSRERDELVELADQRMYRAKRAGKNRVCHS